MPIVKKTIDGEDCFVYVKPKKEIIYEEYESLCILFSDYVNKRKDVTVNQIHVDLKQIYKVIVRVDERKEYFKIFHSGMAIDELKEIALYGYWITKLQPFLLLDETSVDMMSLNLNEGFVTYLLISTLKALCGKTGKNISITNNLAKNLMYGIQHWDLSKESMMLLADAMYEVI